MTIVKIEVSREGLTKLQKQALIKGVSDLVSNVLNKNPQLTHVVIQEYDPDNWSHPGEQAPVRKKGYDC